MQTSRRKVAIAGAGAVGATFAYALAQSGLADEIVLIDPHTDLVRGQAMDLAHGQAFFPTVRIREGSAQDYADARVIVITAGAAQKPGQTRLELLKNNASIVEQIVAQIVRHQSSAVLVVVSNPVDIMTHVAIKASGWDRRRIIGSGTVLDSSRLRHLLSSFCKVDVHNVHAYILGEHGDSEFAAWSLSHVGGVPMDAYCSVCMSQKDWAEARHRIEQRVRDSAYHIIDYKGATWFAVGMALVRIVGAVLRDERSVLTVSALLTGQFGIDGVCLSVPSVVAADGITTTINCGLSEDETASLARSASKLQESTAEVIR